MKKGKKKKYKYYAQTGRDNQAAERVSQQVPNLSLDLMDRDALTEFIFSPEGRRFTQQYQRAGYDVSFDNPSDTIEVSRPTGQYDFNPIFKIFNTLAQLTTGIANKVGDVRGSQREFDEYIKAIQPRPFESTVESGLNNIPVYTKYGGGLKYPYGGGPLTSEGAKEILRDGKTRGKKLTPKQKRYFGYIAGGGKPKKQTGGFHMMPDGTVMPNSEMPAIEAEKGEVYQGTDGGIYKVPESAPTHEGGGQRLGNVTRILEDTSDKRNDFASEMLQVQPDMVEFLTGVKTKSALSHSKTFEKGKKFQFKRTKQLEKALKKNADSLEENPLNNYAENSMDLNLLTLKNVPTQGEMFDELFDHQEFIKDISGISGAIQKAQVGAGVRRLSRNLTPEQRKNYVYNEADGLYYKQEDYALLPESAKIAPPVTGVQTYPGGVTEAGRVTPTGRENPFSFPGGLDAYKQTWSPYMDLSRFNTPAEVQGATYDFLLGTDKGKQVLRQMWGDFGNTAQGLQNQVLTDRFPKGDFTGATLTDADLSALRQSYVDNQLGARTIVPGAELAPPAPNNITRTRTINLVPQPTQRFFEPLNWFDVAGPIDALLSSNRIPVKYNPAEFNQVRLRQQNPLPALQDAQGDYNAALNTIGRTQGSTGAATANVANVFSSKYNIDNQILGNYENLNTQIKNQEILYNANVKDRQSVADQQARAVFENQRLGSLEAQRQQRLVAMDDLYTRLALNRKLNREGNLLMKLFPAFNQFGDYSGYQVPVRPPVGIIPTDATTPVPVQTTTGTTRPPERKFVTLSNGKKIYIN